MIRLIMSEIQRKTVVFLMVESDEEDKAFGYGMFYLFLSFLLGIIFLFLSYYNEGLAIVSIILLVTCPIISAMIMLIPIFFPTTKKTTRQPSKHVTLKKPSRKIYVSIVGVTLLFLVVLFWMVQLQFVRTDEAIVIAMPCRDLTPTT